MERITEKEIREFCEKKQALLDAYFALADTGKLSHAYIIEGAGVRERLLFAVSLSAKLICGNGTPCFKCNLCAGILAGTNPDVKFVTAEGATLSVNEIRAVRTEAYYRPEFSQYKIFVVEDAEKMTVQAQNAFLKILEEPPQNVFFFLLASSKNIFLPTIISRTQSITVDGADIYAAKTELSRYISSEAQIQRVLNVYEALERLEINKKNTEKIQNGLKICEKLFLEGEKFIMDDFPKGNENRDTIALYLDLLLFCAKDILVYKACKRVYGGILCTEEELSSVALRFSSKRANALCEIFAFAKERICENANINTVFSYIFTELTATDD